MSQETDITKDDNQEDVTILPSESGLLLPCCALAIDPNSHPNYLLQNSCDRCKVAILRFYPRSGAPYYDKAVQVGPRGTASVYAAGFFGSIQVLSERDC